MHDHPGRVPAASDGVLNRVARCPSASPDAAGTIPRPASSALRTHACNADFEIPISAQTRFCDIPCVRTRATASRLNSSENFTGMTSSFPPRSIRSKQSRSQPKLQHSQLTGLLDLAGWPDGMRVIVRRERPHPGAQRRFDDVDGYRLTAFATNTRRGQLQRLELRHRRRARCEDRIRNAKDTGLRNLPLHGFDQNQIWTAIVALASEITAWAGLLAHPEHEARRWEPKRLRHRILTIPATIARHGRRTILHLSNRSRWVMIVLAPIKSLRALPAPSR